MTKLKQGTAEEVTGALKKGVMKTMVVNLSQPKPAVEQKDQSYKNHDHIEWFDSDSTFPDKLNERARLSTTHRRILGDKANYCVGSGFIFSGTSAVQAEQYAKKVNAKGETLREVMRKCSRDFARHGNFFIELIRTGDKQVNIEHKDASCCRVHKDGSAILYSRDWKNYRNKSDFHPKHIPLFPNFGQVEGYDQQRCIIHARDYESGYAWYGLPDYIAAYFAGWLDIDYQIPKYNLTRFHNQFRPSGFLVVTGENLNEKQAGELSDKIAKDFTSEGENSKLIISVVNDPSLAPTYIKLDDAPEGAFTILQNLANENIILSHSWHPALVVQQPGKMSNASDIRTAYEYVMSSTICPMREFILETFNKVLTQELNFSIESIEIKNLDPISYSSQVDPMRVMRIGELQKQIGADIDEAIKDKYLWEVETKTNLPKEKEKPIEQPKIKEEEDGDN